MNKVGGFFSGFFLFLLILILGLCGYYIYENFPNKPTNFNTFSLENNTPLVENNLPSKQFYKRMRYADGIIDYHISESCTLEKENSMEEAFEIIESKTLISFNPVTQNNAELSILCSDVSPEAGQENYFVAGEGGPSKVIDSQLYSVILEGKISLFREAECDNPNVAIHELLHALGFDHNNNKDSILYPTLDCGQEIDQEIIESINKLYKDESLPDLVFSLANATKSGRYLNFHIEILNQGLQVSVPLKVAVYSDEKFVEDFDLGAISIGAKKILDVENLAVSSKSKKIDFVVDYDETIREIYENNNKITLNLING